MKDRIEYKVTKQDEGMTLGGLARGRMAVSASLLRQIKWIEGGILLDGQPAIVSVKPKEGQVISLSSGRDVSSEGIIPQDGPVDIVYEDELMLIVDKPGGLAVHPSPGHPDGTLANYVAGLFRARGEELVFHAINRLDKGTSGLMCLAKTKYSAYSLEKALGEGNIARRYYAVCQGLPEPREGTIDLPIGRAEGFGIKRRVDMENGQRAVTHYKLLRSEGGRGLVELRLETGRTHQIRVHMAHMGCPLVGDFMYGQEEPGFGRVALHSYRIEVTLPDRHIVKESPLPEIFQQLLK